MILILSDGGRDVAEIERQLKLHGQKCLFYFSDMISAARYGKGNVIIGEESRRAISRVYAENRISAVIDATEKPMSKLSLAGLSACNDKIKYVKLVSLQDCEGAAVCLYYKELADRIKKCDKNVLLYANKCTVSAIAALSGENADKMFVTVKKSISFDVDDALGYSIPILNVKEYDIIDGAEVVGNAIKRLSIGLVICTEANDTEEKVAAARWMGTDVLLTHSMGIEYPKVVRNIRDAVIEINSGQKKSR